MDAASVAAVTACWALLPLATCGSALCCSPVLYGTVRGWPALCLASCSGSRFLATQQAIGPAATGWSWPDTASATFLVPPLRFLACCGPETPSWRRQSRPLFRHLRFAPRGREVSRQAVQRAGWLAGSAAAASWCAHFGQRSGSAHWRGRRHAFFRPSSGRPRQPCRAARGRRSKTRSCGRR